MLRNAGFLLATELIVRLAALALAVAIARGVGSAGYGQYTYALAYAATYGAFADFGTSRYLTRAIARARHAAADLLAAALLAKGAVLLPSLAVAVALTALQPSMDRPLLLLILAGATAQTLAGLLRAVLYGFERMELDTASRLAERAVAIGGALLALRLGRGLLGVGAALLFAALLDLAIVGMLTTRRCGRPGRAVDLRAVASTLSNALPLGLFGLALALYAGLPLYALESWQGASAAGQYGAAATPIFALIPLPVTVAAAALPVFTRRAAADRAALRDAFALLFRLFFLGGFAAALGTMVVADAVVALVYGRAFAASGAALRILAIGLVGAFPTQVAVNLLVAVGDRRRLLQIDVAALLWQLAVDIVAVPRGGVDGAAIGFASAELVAALFFFTAACRAAGLPSLKPLLRSLPAALGLAATATVLLRAVGLGAAIAGGAVAYIAMLWAFQAISRKDILLARSVLLDRAGPPS